jgi:hypothetical protein
VPQLEELPLTFADEDDDDDAICAAACDVVIDTLDCPGQMEIVPTQTDQAFWSLIANAHAVKNVYHMIEPSPIEWEAQ